MKDRENLEEHFGFEHTSSSGGNPGFSVAVTIAIALIGAMELLSRLLN